MALEGDMSRRSMFAALLIMVLAVPAAAWAHEGHTHNILGTIESVKGEHLEVKGIDGKVLLVMLDAKTVITRDGTKLDATALKVGERVSVDYVQDKNMNMAKAIKLGTAPASPRTRN